MKFRVALPDEAHALALASCFARLRPDRAVVYLCGELGTGKTTFSRGFIQACGHNGKVKSPTYTLIEPYELPQVTIHHLDLYRLSDPEELEYLGVEEACRTGICLIEWPQRGAGVLPEPDLSLSLSYLPQGRQLEAESHTSAADDWLGRVQSHFLADPQIKD